MRKYAQQIFPLPCTMGVCARSSNGTLQLLLTGKDAHDEEMAETSLVKLRWKLVQCQSDTRVTRSLMLQTGKEE